MQTFTDIERFAAGMPPRLVQELGRIDLGRGREELYRAQAPQVLDRLAAQTRFESITASNAIENVVVEPGREIDLIAQPQPRFRDRTEREFAGYKDAIDYLISKPAEPLTVALITHVHRQLMRHTDDPAAGNFKTHNNLIGNRLPDGRVEVVFKPVPAGSTTEWNMTELVDRYEQAITRRTAHPLVLISGLILDLLAIHPFADGNGRVARLITTNELLRHGYGIARYVSLEQRIFESKNSYYEALRASQAGWHEGAHDLWPWCGYLLRMLADAYDTFEQRVESGRASSGTTKAAQVRDYVLNVAPAEFRVQQIESALPDISGATIRKVLVELTRDGMVSAGRGRSAVWRRWAS